MKHDGFSRRAATSRIRRAPGSRRRILRRQWRLSVPLYLLIGYFTMAHAVVIASVRYRLAIKPILILLAASSIAATIEAIGKPARGAPQRADAA